MILVVDVGTTSLKLCVYSASLECLALAESGYSLDTPDASTVQIDPELWWKAFLQSLKKLDYDPAKIEIVSLSVNSPGFSILDRDGNPLLPSFLHLDRRAYPQSKRIVKAIGEEKLLGITGNIPNPGASTAANILWIKEHYPDIDKRVYVYGHANTFFGKRLTGNFGSDPSNLCMSNLFNTVTGNGFDLEIARELGLDLGKMPPVLKSYERVGFITHSVSSITSLPQGVPVVMGANDATCAAVSADIVHSGDIMDVTGTTEMVVVCVDKPLTSPRYNLKNHAVPDRWNAMYALNTGGKAIEWAYKQFFRDIDEDTFYGELIPALVSENRTAIPGFVPFLTGDRYSLRFKTASFTRITLSTTREDMLLGVLYGISRKVEEFLTLMEKRVNLNSVVNVTGGGAAMLMRCKKKLMRDRSFKIVESGSALGAAKLSFMYLES